MDPDLTRVASWLDSSSACFFCKRNCRSLFCRGNHDIRAAGGNNTPGRPAVGIQGAPDTVAPQCPRTKTRLICTTATARVQPPTCECRVVSMRLCADRSRWRLRICPSLFLPSTRRARRPCAAAAGTAWTSRYAVAAHPMVRFKSVSSFPCSSQRAERLARSASSFCTKPLKLSTRLALSHQNEAKRQGEDARPRRQDFSRLPAYVDRPPLCVAQPAAS
jgi:hypothetical protein